jgi:hypothetical protein
MVAWTSVSQRLVLCALQFHLPLDPGSLGIQVLDILWARTTYCTLTEALGDRQIYHDENSVSSNCRLARQRR